MVLEIRLRGAVFLHILEIKKQYFISFKKHILNPVSYFEKMNVEAKSIFCTGTRHSKGVCILFNPSIGANKVKYFLSDNSGRIVLINLNYKITEPLRTLSLVDSCV